MTTTVLDTSALLALLLGEAGSAEVEAAIADSSISTVNFAEAVSYFSKKGVTLSAIAEMLDALPIDVIDADRALSLDAGGLRATTLHAGLSLGDRYCLALAARLGVPAMTADRSWQEVAHLFPAGVRLIR